MRHLVTPPEPALAGGEDALEKAIAVRVPRPALLDVKPGATRSNPSFFVTALFTILTALLLGLCFVIVGIPPLFIQDDRGRRIYVAVMVPLLCVLGTVLSYYATQHPQRMFNSALAQVTKEMEQHAAYLTIAVGNVERELAARAVNMGDAAGTVQLPDLMRNRSAPVTPMDPALQQFSSVYSPGLMNAALSSAMPSVTGAEFFRGIDKLEEERDMVIATVHVGREWRWLLNHLRELNLRNLSGPSNPLMHHQRVAVRALAISVARVEKLILSLYYSSFILHRVNALAPANPWGPTLMAGPGSAFCNHPAMNRGSAHARAAASVFQAPTPLSGAVRLHPPNEAETYHSTSESIFTLPKATPRGSVLPPNPDDDPVGGGRRSPAFDVASGSQLTSPDTRGFALGKQVCLPQFPPLFSGARGSGSGAATRKNEKKAAAAAAAEAELMSPVERALHLDPHGDAVEPPSKGKKKDKKGKVSKSAAAATAVASNGRASGAGNGNEGESHSLCSVAETEGNDGEDEVVDVSDASDLPGAPSRRNGSATVAPSRSQTANITVQVRSRMVTSLSGTAGAGAGTTAAEAAVQDAAATDNNGVFAPPPTTREHPPSQLPKQRQALAGPPGPANGHAEGVAEKLGDVNASLTSSSAPLLLPLGSPPRRRQPGSARVPSATLVLHRGARFVGDETDIFTTILVHVRKGNLTRYSRLYGALAHTGVDAATRSCFFQDGSASHLTRSSSIRPFTIYHISDHDGEREGLTILEQKLLHFVHCRPEDVADVASESGGGGSVSKDLASLSTAHVHQESSVSAVGDATALPSSLPVRTTTSVFAERVDSFILAMQLLPDRPMRLAFLTVVVEAVRRRGAGGMSMTYSGTSMQSLSTPPLTHTMGSIKELQPVASLASESLSAPLPLPKTVPVLECVIDDVLCVLTKMEITVGASFAEPSKILLVGVSLEDMSEPVSQRDDMDGDESPHVAVADSLAASVSSQSLSAAAATKRPAVRSNAPRGLRLNAVQSAIGTPEMGSIVQRVNGDHCTLGQEFREVIHFE